MTATHRRYFFCSIFAAAAIYIFSQWPALTNPYVVNDDTRQQIFWMQKWIDADLYPDDMLSRYATNYVPWGVQAIYRLAAPWINPLQFTKILAVVLFIVTAGFLFHLGLAAGDELLAILVVCVFCFLGDFMARIAGGLSQSFGYPLLCSYLYFLSRRSLIGASVVLLLGSLLNPYIFLLCLVAQAIYLLHNHWRTLVGWSKNRLRPRTAASSIPEVFQNGADSSGSAVRGQDSLATKAIPSRLAWSICLMVIACGLNGLKYVFFTPAEFGSLVSMADMAGHPEYTALGRYEIIPVPSLLFELIRPWQTNLPFRRWGLVGGWSLAAVGLAIVVYAVTRRPWLTNLFAFRVFVYLFPASLLLYFAADAVLFRLFLPSRYVELSLNVFYCLVVAVCLRETQRNLLPKRRVFPLVVTALMMLAGLQLYHTGIYNYSDQAKLYQYLQSTPKASLLAGHPDLMDNTITFGQRKCFVTYELSHTWYKTYWQEIKRRTFDLFEAYYSDDPERVLQFCRKNKIDYFIIREKDYTLEQINQPHFYFQPFLEHIRKLFKNKSQFALLDRKLFPPVFEGDGVRVIRFTGQ